MKKLTERIKDVNGSGLPGLMMLECVLIVRVYSGMKKRR